APEADNQDTGTEEQKAAKVEQEKNRRAGGWQRKIERQQRELEELRALLVRQQAQAATAQQPAANTNQQMDPAQDAEAYIANIVAQRMAAAEEQRRQVQVQAEFQRRTQEVRAQNPDFDEVLMTADAPVSQAVQQALLTSEHGPAIMYQLAKNPAELARLSALPPLDAAREIGRLEAKASVTAAPKPATKTATRPPAPPTNVNGSTSSTRSLEELPISEYKRALRSGRR
ncbi:MAG: hypothetical protein ACREXY_05465, partial [Gammaproteobacteria bacterium]